MRRSGDQAGRLGGLAGLHRSVETLHRADWPGWIAANLVESQKGVEAIKQRIFDRLRHHRSAELLEFDAKMGIGCGDQLEHRVDAAKSGGTWRFGRQLQHLPVARGKPTGVAIGAVDRQGTHKLDDDRLDILGIEPRQRLAGQLHQSR